MLSIQIAMVSTLILSLLHNPQNKTKIRNTMLTIFKTIRAVYADDVDFQ